MLAVGVYIMSRKRRRQPKSEEADRVEGSDADEKHDIDAESL